MDTLERLIEIVRQNAPEALKAPSNTRTCWLDGDECPYGRPDGKFIYRPVISCIIPIKGGNGCSKLFDNTYALDQMRRAYIEGQTDEGIDKGVQERIDNWVSKEGVTLDSELRVVADELEGVDKVMLQLAADIIKEAKPDYRIARIDNL